MTGRAVRKAFRRWHVVAEMAREPNGKYAPEWQPELAALAWDAVCNAAVFAGETPDAAKCFADQPDAGHAYNLKRIALAVGMFPRKGAFYWFHE